MPNRLINETSPYLLQHANNPVDWYPYGDEAFAKAKAENKPILFSIGYSSCHWCHVMERESFENDSIAHLMNDLFVCVKVDREERPDVDHFYMDAVQLLYGHGGWPLNCFATPEGKPFWGGTYFKPDQWKDILKNVSNLYKDQNRDFVEQAREVTDHLMNNSYFIKKPEERLLDENYFDDILYLIRQQFDEKNGGFAGAPKFPMPMAIQLLLQYYYAFGKKDSFQHALLTIRNMTRGGIYDQVGGGFARYAVDDHWRVPHFEKMLYDNALLVSLYCNAYRISKDEAFKDIVEGTLEFIKRELTSPEGLFYSSLDADSDGQEGYFYTWSKAEFDEVLGPYSNLMAEYFGMGKPGQWEEGRCILFRPETDSFFAQSHFLSEEELRALVKSSRALLMEKRDKRNRPGLDDKVLLSWNGLMIKAYTDAYATFGNSEYLGIALNAARLLSSLLQNPEGGVFHTWKKGKARIAGFLDDYTFFADACLGIYQLTLDNSWLAQAEALVKYAIVQFAETESGLFFFSEQKHKCIVRKTETYDSVIPSSNSSFARLLHALGTLTGKNAYLEISDMMLSVMTEKISNYPSSYANWVLLAMERSLPFYVIAVVGEDAHEKIQELGNYYIPFTLIAGSTVPGDMPYIRNRFVAGKTLIHICNENSCFAPVESIEKAIDLLRISAKLVE